MAGNSRESNSKKRIYLLANPDKPDAAAILEDLAEFASTKCEVVGTQLGLDGTKAIEAGAEILVVISGDGTIIGVARSLGENQLPIVGINAGKLGFLAEFSADEFKHCLDRILTDESFIRRRTVLEVALQRNGDTRTRSLAVNDCVIHAGAPFRSIRLNVSVAGSHLTEMVGDGLIVCTPSGSTAHNLAAGGPILQPGIDAIVLTPLCPHSLTHRPLVMQRDSVIEVTPVSVNEGTTVIIDGQVSWILSGEDRVTIRSSESHLLRIRHPDRPRWYNLVSKLHWGKGPSYE